MKNLILLLVISLVVSCKKENPVEPTPIVTPTPTPVHITGDAIFYIKTTSGTLNVVIDSTVNLGNMGMMPMGWKPDCKTTGWCLKYSDKHGTHNYVAKLIKPNGDSLVKSGNFLIVGGGCLTIGI